MKAVLSAIFWLFLVLSCIPMVVSGAARERIKRGVGWRGTDALAVPCERLAYPRFTCS